MKTGDMERLLGIPEIYPDWQKRQMFVQILRDFVKGLKVEIRSPPCGHMGTAQYYLVVEHDGEELLRVDIGDDGFDDGENNGFRLHAVREEKKK